MASLTELRADVPGWGLPFPYRHDLMLTSGEVAAAFGVDVGDVVCCLHTDDVHNGESYYRASEAMVRAHELRARYLKREAIKRRRARLREECYDQRVTVRDEVRAGVDERILYALHNPDSGLTKIGITDNLRRRVDDLENACGSQFTVLHYVVGNRWTIECREMELHERFDVQRRVGEWFRLTEDEQATLKEAMHG
jgi:predicted GIY-YIG superfamily endonuclease